MPARKIQSAALPGKVSARYRKRHRRADEARQVEAVSCM